MDKRWEDYNFLEIAPQCSKGRERSCHVDDCAGKKMISEEK